jgi:hypothetical protein
MSFTNRISQIFDIEGYVYAIEYNASDFNITLPALSNQTGITRRLYTSLTWENIAEIELYLSGVSNFSINCQKVYKNGTDVIISFIETDTVNNDNLKLHIFTSTDGGVTFPTHDSTVVKVGSEGLDDGYYRHNLFYKIGNSIYQDRINALVKFDATLGNATMVSATEQLNALPASYGNVRYGINDVGGRSIRIKTYNVITKESTIQFIDYTNFSTNDTDRLDLTSSEFVKINGKLFLYLYGIDPLFKAFYIPSTDGITFDAANILTFNSHYIKLKYNSIGNVYYYISCDATNAFLMESSDLITWTRFDIPATETTLNSQVSVYGLNILDLNYTASLSRYSFATATDHTRYYSYDKTTLYYHYTAGTEIRGNGTGFIRKNSSNFGGLEYSTDLVTWTTCDYSGSVNRLLIPREGFGWIGVPFDSYTTDGVTYSTNGINWSSVTIAGEPVVDNVPVAEADVLRLDLRLDNNGDYKSFLNFNTTTFAFDTISASLRHTPVFLSAPFLIRNNTTTSTKLISVDDALNCTVVSSDAAISQINLRLNPLYLKTGVAGFYDDANELKFSAAYIDAIGVSYVDIIHFTTIWEVESTINISAIYDFSACAFDPHGGPIVVTKADGYYFIFGKLINLNRPSASYSMTHFDILLKGTTFGNLSPISLENQDIETQSWMESAYVIGVEATPDPNEITPGDPSVYIFNNPLSKVDGSNIYLFKVNDPGIQGFTSGNIVLTDGTFATFTPVGSAFNCATGDRARQVFGLASNGNFLLPVKSGANTDIVEVTTSGTSSVLYPSAQVICVSNSRELPIEQIRTYGTADRYCLVAAYTHDPDAIYCIRILDTQTSIVTSYDIDTKTIVSTIPNASVNITGTKLLNSNMYLISEANNGVDYAGVEIFKLDLSTGIVSFNSVIKISSDPNDSLSTDYSGSSYPMYDTTFLTHTNHTTNVYKVLKIDGALSVTTISTTTPVLTGAEYVNDLVVNGVTGDAFIMIAAGGNTTYRMDPISGGTTTTGACSILRKYRPSTITISGNYIGILDNVNFTVIDMTGAIVATIARVIGTHAIVGGTGFDDPMTHSTLKIRFGTGKSNASSTHYVRNIVAYGSGANTVFTVIAYQYLADTNGK